MERRDFLKLASLTGLSVVAGGATIGGGEAEAFDNYDGPLWMFLHAGGGWDPTSLCDPKGDANGMNKYPTSAIKAAGNIRWAPMELSPDVANNPDQALQVQTIYDNFFQTYYNQLTVINGIDTSTNSHDAGTRHTWTGSLTEGGAALAALVAAEHAPVSPMGFITNGGYDNTGGTVAAVRTGNTGALFRIAFPNRINPQDDNPSLFHTEETFARIQAARAARTQALIEQQNLPRIKNAMSSLALSRTGQNELAQLTEYLPDDLENGLKGQGQLAIAAYRAGLCCSVNLSHGGFDSHGNNDVAQSTNHAEGLDAVDFILRYAEEQGIRQNIVIVMGSDFGRTNGYNDGNGKDHWSITSMMVIGSIRGQDIPGNKVIGDSGPNQSAGDVNGVTITPAHVHQGLRRLAGIESSEAAAMFPLGVEQEIDFFS